MSAASQVAVLAEPRRGGATARDRAAPAAERPLVRLAAFTALGLYGILRWAALLGPAPGGRLLGLLGLSVAVAALGAAVATRSPAGRAVTAAAATVGTIAALLAMLALSGVPVAWLRHLRIALIADGIGAGLSGLPRAVVPYSGIDDWVRTVIVLGAGVLLLDAALVLALTTRALGDLRRAGAALPLVALSVVPMTLVRPALPYLQGLLLFALLAAFIWGERVRAPEAVTAVTIAALAGVAAMVAAPALDRHRPWLDYEALTGTLEPAHSETFDWNQTYAPLNWPRTGREIFDVHAARPEYWKAEDLDDFNGYSWVQGIFAELRHSADPPSATVSRYTQTIQVSIRALDTTDLIAAGVASEPKDTPEQVIAGSAPGTWATASGLQPGDSYRVGVYAPSAVPSLYGPTPAELAGGGDSIPAALSPYLTLAIPGAARGAAGDARSATVVFAPFHAARADATAAVTSSPYAKAYGLAQQLARAPTPYAFAQRIVHYLSTDGGFVYSEHPSSSRYPLESFLFATKTGYCQQFSGAMALLLRMGGVPARVGAGFTTGTYDSATKQYVVSDTDAHDWVEAWMPGYGWVTFDPTPASAPARGGQAPVPAIRSGVASVGPVPLIHHQDLLPGSASAVTRASPRGSSGVATAAEVLLAATLAVALLVALAWRLAAAGAGDQLTELERALRRCGRPVSGGVTLAALERRLGASGDAAAYIKAIRLERFGDGPPPTPQQRRALRAALRAGLGLSGAVRALWALPPRWPFAR